MTDILETLEALAAIEHTHLTHLPKVAVPREVLRLAVAEIRSLRVQDRVFDLVGHLSHPSRDNPLAAAAAIHLLRAAQNAESSVAPVDGPNPIS
jgi:hypothetical protein